MKINYCIKHKMELQTMKGCLILHNDTCEKCPYKLKIKGDSQGIECFKRSI